MKKRILHINSVCGFGSTGNLVADLTKSTEYDSLVCFGRKKDYSRVNSYKFANIFDNCIGALRTIFFDNNLNICSGATKKLIKKIKEYNPDIIHLHNLHGYYVNVKMLFDFLKEYRKPVIWTLHDCWGVTGYCPHFESINCNKYKTKCVDCLYGFSYPFSLFKQNVEKEFEEKKKLFNSIDNMTIITPSEWLKRIVKNSFITNADIYVINNGFDIEEQKIEKNDKFTVIAVANYWTKEKGKDELKKVIPLLDKDIYIVIVGNLKDNDPIFKRCKLIKRISDCRQLYKEYSKAHIFINPTLQDNFPTVNIESIGCGTPVITYNTGGSPEIIDSTTGIVIDKYDYKQMANVINSIKINYYFKLSDLQNRAKMFSREKMISNYSSLYNNIFSQLKNR